MEKLIRKEIKKLPSWQKFVLLLIVIAISFYFRLNREIDSDVAYLMTCVDGDTARLRINGVEERVRFLAVDTPELSSKDYFAQEAANFTCNALKGADVIRVEYDPDSDMRDKYDRVLAWIFVDDELLQASLIEGGYARVRYIYGDYLYVNQLNRLQEQAKYSKVGVWK